MRRQAASLWSSCSSHNILLRPRINIIGPAGARFIRIASTPSSSPNTSDASPADLDLTVAEPSSSPDARFEVLGAPFSLLSVQLSPSQKLYTRRGNLAAVSGKVDNVVSTLSLLSPLTRAFVGVPFLYQKISSVSPVSLLIGTPSPTNSLAVVHLDGRLDWLLTQRTALLAWTGHNLTLHPRLNTRLSFQHWGTTLASGRGLLALVGKGQIYQVTLNEGEEYIAHPSHVVAYTQNYTPPQPYRLRSTNLKLQIPSISGLLPDTRFFNEMKKSPLWKSLARTFYNMRTWTRRSIFGDRLFLQFKGPTTILLQSRGGRLRDSLSREEINEVADSPAGTTREVVFQEPLEDKKNSSSSSSGGGNLAASQAQSEPKMKYATVQGGKVDFSKQ